jgi:hypothetical protein
MFSLFPSFLLSLFYGSTDDVLCQSYYAGSLVYKSLCSHSSRFSSSAFLKIFKTFTNLVISDVLASSFEK